LSVAFWYIGYNSVTSKYSVYAPEVLGVGFNTTLLVAMVVAFVAFVPVAIISSKLGRRKTILLGVALLGGSFLVASFMRAGTSEWLMYIFFGLAGIGWAAINVNSFPMVVELATGSDVGKYTGLYYTASMAAQAVAPVLGGVFLDWIGMEALFPFGFVAVALSFVTMLFVRHGDAKPTVSDVIENADD
jgi:MFS family permease